MMELIKLAHNAHVLTKDNNIYYLFSYELCLLEKIGLHIVIQQTSIFINLLEIILVMEYITKRLWWDW